MRDREFAVAHKALIESTQDKTTIPESFRLIGNGVLHGKKGKVHTLVIPVSVPQVKFDHARTEVRGDGKLLEPPREFEVHSWVRNFYNWMVSQGAATNGNDGGAFADGSINLLDTTNTLRSAAAAIGLPQYGSPETGTYAYSSLVTVTTQGIVVGTNAGVSGEDEDDYALDTQIAHGVAATQLYYATHQIPAVYTFDGSRVFTRNLTRYFDNFSGGVISIEEIGLISRMLVSAYYNILVARDVITTLAVPFRAQAAITYNFTITYPSTGSPLRNFYNMLVSQAMSLSAKGPTFTDGLICGTDTGGNVRTHATLPFGFITNTSLHAAGYGAMGAAGDVSQGVVVGSDSTAVLFDDYALGALIDSGVAAGELQYSISEVPTRSWADPILSTNQARTFTNGSAGDVTVRESGLIYETHMGSIYFYLMLKDVFSDVVISPAEDLRVVYQPQVTYP